MLLVVDIGNTCVTFGVFSGEELVNIYKFSSDSIDSRKIELIFKENNIKDCVIGSVVNELNETICGILESLLGKSPILLSFKSNFGIKLCTKFPETVGMDRIANVVGAKKYSKPFIVVDMGTATTFDIANKNGDFCGGIILPGINTQLKSLNDYTSKLPLLEPKNVEKVISNTTENCILSGVVKGHACAVEGLITECEKELGEKAVIIGTGGLCKLVSNHMDRNFDYIEPNLTLIGLKELYKLQI